MPLRKIVQKLSHAVAGATVVVGGICALMIAQEVEFQFFPVKDLKTIDLVEVRGDDLFVAGSFRKLRNCEYIKPVRGVDETGRNLYIVSHSVSASQNWQTSDEAQRFGPWQIVGGAGRKVKLYQEYACHDLWRQFDNVGTIDTRVTPYIIEVAK